MRLFFLWHCEKMHESCVPLGEASALLVIVLAARRKPIEAVRHRLTISAGKI